MPDRRSIVTMLGLAPLAAGFDAQSFSEPEKMDRPINGPLAYNREKFALALERLAAAVRDDTLTPIRMGVQSELGPNSIVNQYSLAFDFFWKPDGA